MGKARAHPATPRVAGSPSHEEKEPHLGSFVSFEAEGAGGAGCDLLIFLLVQWALTLSPQPLGILPAGPFTHPISATWFNA